MNKCYYDNHFCKGQLWQCRTCGEWFCQYHGHYTWQGQNVECVACERAREEAIRTIIEGYHTDIVTWVDEANDAELTALVQGELGDAGITLDQIYAACRNFTLGSLLSHAMTPMLAPSSAADLRDEYSAYFHEEN